MPGNEDFLKSLRHEMVDQQIMARGIDDERVLSAMRKVPRHLFVPEKFAERSYSDEAIGIGPGQSISQPYIVALMLSSLALKKDDKVLDVGTGSGYQTALLSEIAGRIFTIEIDPKLSAHSAGLLARLGFRNIEARAGDGSQGWAEEAPFDAIVVSAACDSIPRELVRQLKAGGRMILPLGDEVQYLVLLTKNPEGLDSQDLGAVQFVRMQAGK